jgi:predicted phosphodiesterase
MDLSRRFFIAGAASFGAFGGNRFLRAASGISRGTPKLTFGVVSDIHFTRKIGTPEYEKDSATFRHTLAWFRDQGVDGVMIAGDMADKGTVDELMGVAHAWYAVFPEDRAPDGRKVEKLFVTGNHDWEGYRYGDTFARRYPDAAERARQILATDYAGNWQRIFNEPFSAIARKTIKGYTFIGTHWTQGGCRGCDENGTPGLLAYMAKHGAALDPSLPFFYYQHPHPKDTCYGPWAWGHDSGESTRALAPFANAVAFSGHSHYSLTHEKSIWQGAFTSIGTSSLRYTAMTQEALPPRGYENSRAPRRQPEIDGVKVMKTYAGHDGRQGMLVRVYGDCMVISRRDFVYDKDLGNDWVMPLTCAESRPFAFAQRAKKALAPEFPPHAALTLSREKAKNRGAPADKKNKQGVPSTLRDAVKISFPAANAVPAARVYAYEVAIEKKDGSRDVRHVLAQGFNMNANDKRAKGDSFCTLACDQLPKEAYRFAVTPVSSLEKRGRALVSAWQEQA